jgi:hypothetical protein
MGNPQSSSLISGKLYLNIDTSICPMYQRGNLIELAAAILGKTGPEDLSSLTEMERKILGRDLKGLLIVTIHRGDAGLRKRFKVIAVSGPHLT